jgi:ribosome-binding factor A
MSRRVERVKEQLRRELMALLQREVKDPRIHAITLTHVDAAPDLRHARLLVHGSLDEKERSETLEGLRAATPFLRGALGRRLRMRRIPELTWAWDETLEHAQHIERLLSEAKRASGEPQAGDDADGGE